METDRKLKRGLADLSRFFAEDRVLRPPVERSQPLTQIVPTRSVPDNRLPRLICTSFLYSPEIFKSIDLLRLLDQIKVDFEEVFLLSVVPQNGDSEESQTHSASTGSSERALPLQRMGDRITFGQVSSAELERILQPRVNSHSDYDFSPSRKALVVFDSIFQNRQASHFNQIDRGVLGLLVHCIFVVPVDLEGLMRTYELIRACFAQNPALNGSLLLVGSRAHRTWELVFERLNAIVSDFLGRDLGFMGWVEQGQARLNLEPLMEEGRHVIQQSSKVWLSEALYANRLKGIDHQDPALIA